MGSVRCGDNDALVRDLDAGRIRETPCEAVRFVVLVTLKVGVAVHESDPPSECIPAGQGRQSLSCVRASTAEYVFLGHGMHADAFKLPVSGLNDPIGHGEHRLCRRMELNVPGGHELHVEHPSVAAKVPAEQFAHADEPELGLNVPAEHAEQ